MTQGGKICKSDDIATLYVAFVVFVTFVVFAMLIS